MDAPCSQTTAATESPSAADRLFPANLLHASWQKFRAQRYTTAVTGVIYRGTPRPTCGMPLGGIDTGCIDIEPNGMLGYSTVFNHLVRPRLLLNLPFLGIHVDGITTVLISDRLAKQDRPFCNSNIMTFPDTDYTPRYDEIELDGVELADSIDYWGHYPVLDMEYRMPASVRVGLRAWSPFVPGDTVASMAPGAVFEVHLRNPGDGHRSGTLAFSFPGFEHPESDGAVAVARESLSGVLNGMAVTGPHQGNQWEMAYLLAALETPDARSGAPLNADGAAWAGIASALPAPGPAETGVSLAVDFDLAPGETRIVRFVLAWYAPRWKAGGAPTHKNTDTHVHMYARHYPDPRTTAALLAAQSETLLARIIAWQNVLYTDPEIPGWLADSLINNLHLITECAVWGEADESVGAWCHDEDGLFGLNECPRGCPQIECIPCSFYGSIPLPYFFPDAALSTLRGYKAYQYDDGRPPWIFGGCTAREENSRVATFGLGRPDKGYQTVLNSACYIVVADRYWRITGDDAMLAEFWDSLKRANDFSMNLRPEYGPSQVVAMPSPGTDPGGLSDTEWFEAPEPGWKGYVTHAGAIRMAQVQIMRRMAEAMNDDAYMKECDDRLAAGAEALEDKLWNGDCYLNFNDPDNDEKSDLVFGYQLDGQWITDWHGVPGAFPPNRAATTLETIRKFNCALSDTGAVNYANPDGSPAQVGGYGTYSYFPPELYMLAMTFMYGGEKEYGADLLRRCVENITCRWGYTWDAINTVQGERDSGERAFGADYYQNMMLWAVPAALTGEDMEQPARPGGLVDRIIRAGSDSGR